MARYTDLFFDLDNTIWDFTKSSLRALDAVYKEFKLNKYFNSFEDFVTQYKQLNNKLWDQYRKGEISKDTLSVVRFLYLLEGRTENLQLSTVQQMASKYLAVMTEQPDLEPGAFEVIKALYEKGYRINIISDGFFEVQILKLKTAKLSSFIAHLITAEEVGVLKPDKKLFEYALNKANANKETTLVIGDDYQNDILGAKNAGIDQVFYNKFSVPEDSLEIKPTYVIHKLTELTELL